MAYYTALQTAWNSVTQPPTGVTGQRIAGWRYHGAENYQG